LNGRWAFDAMQKLPRKYYVNCLGLRNKIGRVMWAVVYHLLFRPFRPACFRRWRNLLLRLFGARIGKHSTVHATAVVWAPWNLEMGDFTAVAPGANLYNVARITLGTKTLISQEAFLCTASHDVSAPGMDLITRPITVHDDAWVTARALVCPGVKIGNGAVIAAGAVVTRDVEPWTVVGGNPARFIKRRVLRGASDVESVDSSTSKNGGRASLPASR